MSRFQLKITDEQASTVDLSGTDAVWTEYTPAMPEIVKVTALSATEDGGEQTGLVFRNPTELCRVEFLGSIETVRATIARLNLLFRQAERYQRRRTGQPVYLEMQRPTSGAWQKSEILNGRIELSAGMLDSGWATGYVEAVLHWTRRYYWQEGGVLLPLTNRNGTNSLSPLTVYNHKDSDAGHDNFVEIAAGDITGDLPGPVSLTLTNTAGSAAGDLFVALGANGNITTMTHMLEAETGRIGGVTLASGTASNGGYTQQPVTTSWAEFMRWTLDGSFLAGLDRSFFRLLGRFYTAPPANTQVKAQINLGSGQVLWEGPVYMLATTVQIQEIGLVQLPPQPVGASNFGTLYLSLFAKNTGGVVTLNTDYVQLSWLDGWRQYKPKTNGIASSSHLTDNGAEQLLYTAQAGLNRLANYVAYGAPLWLRPGETHRLYILHQDTSGAADATRTLTVQVTHYPRRLTI